MIIDEKGYYAIKVSYDVDFDYNGCLDPEGEHCVDEEDLDSDSVDELIDNTIEKASQAIIECIKESPEVTQNISGPKGNKISIVNVKFDDKDIDYSNGVKYGEVRIPVCVDLVYVITTSQQVTNLKALEKNIVDIISKEINHIENEDSILYWFMSSPQTYWDPADYDTKELPATIKLDLCDSSVEEIE